MYVSLFSLLDGRSSVEHQYETLTKKEAGTRNQVKVGKISGA